MKRLSAACLVLALWALAPSPAEAALTVFQTYTGNVGLSTDGFGSLSNSGVISADVPAGATVVAAFLYSSTNFNSNPVGGTLNGTPVAYGAPVVNTSATFLAASRADVTSIVAPVINGGPGGVYNFNVTETSGSQDGEALVVVYSLASLPNATVGLLDGFSAVGGDTTSLNFATPLDPTAPGFFAEMRLGIGFSCCGQDSNVTVNGTTITESAGNFDDGTQQGNGSLITMGGFDDPFSPSLPSYADDHERYNLVPYINNGDVSIVVQTNNPTSDDNIFLAAFYTAGLASVNEPPPTTAPVPEPASLSLLAMGLGGLALKRFRRTGQPS